MQSDKNNNENVGFKVLKSENININPGNEIYLKIKADGAYYSFYYATQEGDWQPLLENADGTILCTAKAGGFVGTFFAMYAYAE